METTTYSDPFPQIQAASSTVFATRRAPNLHLQQISAKLPKVVHALVVSNNASWHTSKKLKVPDNVWLLHLPPYSPQLNSAENLFQYFKKTFIANRVFETTDILKEAVLDGLNKLAKNTDHIKSIGKRL